MKVAHADRYSREDIFGKYRLLNHIARSQSCDVWEAMHVVTNRRHAVKLMLPGLKGKADHLRALRLEYAIGSSLKHAVIIRMDEFQQENGIAFLAMEYFDAPSMKHQIVQNGDSLAPRIKDIARQAAAGLDHVHRQGWIHRDIKPENFLLSDEGKVRLIDFSLAQKQRRWWNSFLGGGSQIQGTPTYLSPEQIRKKPLDVRSDIYSFGCVLFELVSSKPPYTAPKTNDLLNRHLKAPVPSLKAAVGEVSKGFSDLVSQMLAKEPQQRPTSMEEVLREIEKVPVFEKMPQSE